MGSNNYKVNITDEASADLDEIFKYIAVELSNGDASQGLLDDIVNGVENIATFPYAMPNLNSADFHELRRLDIKNFVIIYSVDEDKHDIYFLAILYAKSDIVARLLRRI